jgi:hypothetical protein
MQTEEVGPAPPDQPPSPVTTGNHDRSMGADCCPERRYIDHGYLHYSIKTLWYCVDVRKRSIMLDWMSECVRRQSKLCTLKRYANNTVVTQLIDIHIMPCTTRVCNAVNLCGFLHHPPGSLFVCMNAPRAGTHGHDILSLTLRL